ncbi:MAG: hypothetical protein QOF24_2738 [Verrucomicrobiota bacterium]|jgi:hypothetical protein
MSAHQRIVLRFAIVGFTAFGLAAALYAYLIKVSPVSPDPRSGHVHAMHQHGYIFFVTANQRFGFFALLAHFAFLLLIAGTLSVYWKDIPRSKSFIELFRRNI